MKTLIIAALMLIGTCAWAQTNTPPPVAPLPDSTAADWSKALGDLGFHVSAATMSLIVLIGLPFIKTLAGYLRKLVPKNVQVNKAGILLAHIAGVDNPTLESLAAEIPKVLAVQPQPAAPAAQPKV